MRKIWALSLVGILGFGLGGCAHRAPAESAAAKESAVSTPVPPDSPLAKVKVGMSEQEVREALGPPTQENEYVTGKAFIPWYFGPDRSRRAYFYKGMGRVVFSGGSGFNRTGKVSRVEYDPSEPGNAR